MRTGLLILVMIHTMSLAAQLRLDEEFYENGNLYWKGHIKSGITVTGEVYSFQFGFWQYWYEAGNLKQEIYYADKMNEARYINMWNPDGEKILENGNGVIFQVDDLFENADSNVFEVKDSVINGKFRMFRKWKNDEEYADYYLVSEGSYFKNMQVGESWFHDPKLDCFIVEHYTDGQKHGAYELKNNEDLKIEKGQFCYGKKCGEWRYFKNGKLDRIENYEDGVQTGQYYEYYPNGNIKLAGQFLKALKIVQQRQFDPESFEEKISEIKAEVGVKDGVWKFFDVNGKLVKEEVFDRGEKK